MRRREFVGLIAGAAAWPIGASAQQHRSSSIGVLSQSNPERSFTRSIPLLRAGLQQTGHVEGRTFSFQYRWAHGQLDQLGELAKELVNVPVDVIVAFGRPSALAAAAATTTIPVVFYMESDPVNVGLAAAMNRPGRNVTGMTGDSSALATKRQL